MRAATSIAQFSSAWSKGRQWKASGRKWAGKSKLSLKKKRKIQK